MPLEIAEITFDPSDYAYNDFTDLRRTKVYATTNAEDDVIHDVLGNHQFIGAGTGVLNEDGTGSISVPTPGAGSIPSTWQTTIHFDTKNVNEPSGRKLVSFGPFTITESKPLGLLVEENYLPPEYEPQILERLNALEAGGGGGGSFESTLIVNADTDLPNTTPDGRILYVDVRTAATVEGVPLTVGLWAFRRTATAWAYYALPTGTPVALSTPGDTPTVPGAPTNLAGTPAGDGSSITATWDPPAGTPAAIGYAYRVTVGGSTSAWVDVDTAETATFATTSGTAHTIAVAAYATEGGSYGTSATADVTTPAGFSAVSDFLNTADSTTLTAHTTGGYTWLAPQTGDNGVTTVVATIVDRRVGGSTMGGHVVLPQDDCEVSVRYTIQNGGQVRLHGRGKGAHVFLTDTGALRSETYLGGADIVTGLPFYGVLTLRAVGSTVSVWVDGVKKTEFAAVASTGSRWGFAALGTAYIDDIRFGPATDHTTAPSVIGQQTAAGTIITSDAFTGSDANIAARVSDASLGGTGRHWLTGEGAAGLRIVSNQLAPPVDFAYTSSYMPINNGNAEITATLTAIPTAGDVRLFIRQPKHDGRGYMLRITPTAITPAKSPDDLNNFGGTSFGAPQVGDVYTIKAIDGVITFTAKRSGGADIAAPQVKTDTGAAFDSLSPSWTKDATHAGVLNGSNGEGWRLDSLIVTGR